MNGSLSMLGKFQGYAFIIEMTVFYRFAAGADK